MKKYLTLEVLVDEAMEDAKECAEEVINEATGHYYCCDGTVKINIVEKDNKHNSNMEDRKITLLRACMELLQKQESSHYILDLLSETVYYDEADCDGYCLLEDIKTELGIED